VSDYCTYFIIGFCVEVARKKQEQSQHLFLWNCSLTYFALERIIRAFSFPRTHFGCGGKKKSDTKPIDRTRRLWICKLELPFVGKTYTMPGETTLFPSFVQGEIEVKDETKFLQQIQRMQIVKNLVEAGVRFRLLVGRDLLISTDDTTSSWANFKQEFFRPKN